MASVTCSTCGAEGTITNAKEGLVAMPCRCLLDGAHVQIHYHSSEALDIVAKYYDPDLENTVERGG